MDERPPADVRAGLRTSLRDRRRMLSDDEQRGARVRIVGRLVDRARLDHWQAVLGYVAHDGEIDPAEALDCLRHDGVVVGLPRVEGSAITFHRCDADTSMERGVFDIAVPIASAPVLAPAEVDAVLMPLVGFDDQGNRLGMGGGYYDRMLADTPTPLRIGLAHDCQRLTRLRAEDWDARLDLVLTPTMTLVPPLRNRSNTPFEGRSRP